ncbi:MAG: GntR family transcriptional regulator [Cryobacterium sp.]|nr:GntR family transcriptional regulator [Cryobacterium sp.]
MAKGTPAVEGAYRQLLEHLGSGYFSAGTRLPAERQLSIDLGISRTTLRLALSRLADEGLVIPSSNRGWFVRKPGTGATMTPMRSFTEMAASRRLVAGTRVIQNLIRPATYDEARTLSIAPVAEVVDLVRVRLLDGIAICHDHTILPRELVPSLAETEMTDASLYEFLKSVAGIEILRSDYTIRAELMAEDLAALLNVDAGSPALVAEEISFSRGEEPVLLATLTYRGDAYRFQTHQLWFRSGT